MQRQRPLILPVTALTIVFGFLATATPLFAASKEKVLHSFGKDEDGASPYAGLISDAAGNLYGANGNWADKVLHSFGKAGDGGGPYADLIFDAAGNLYGTTLGGGAHEGGPSSS
jgi:hypothetical protein